MNSPPTPSRAVPAALAGALGTTADLARAPSFKASDFLAAPAGIRGIQIQIQGLEKMGRIPFVGDVLPQFLWV